LYEILFSLQRIKKNIRIWRLARICPRIIVTKKSETIGCFSSNTNTVLPRYSAAQHSSCREIWNLDLLFYSFFSYQTINIKRWRAMTNLKWFTARTIRSTKCCARNSSSTSWNAVWSTKTRWNWWFVPSTRGI